MPALGPRLSIVAGLILGVLAAVALLAGVVAFAPEPEGPTPSVALPSLGTSTASPVAASDAPSPSTTGASSPAPSSAGSGLFHVGEAAPTLVLPQVGGGTIDLRRIGTDIMVEGLRSILSGVDITP